MIDSLAKKIEKLIWSDHLQGLGRLGGLASTILRYLYGMLRDMLSGQLTLHAMSLVYTTLLSIVPLLGISFAMAKGLGVFSKLRENLDTFLVHLGPDAERISAQLFDMVDKVNTSVIGGIGVAFFLWTAISTVQKVESSFNYVWYVSKPRNFARRFTEYLVVLLIGPVAIGTAFTMLGALSSNAVVSRLEQLPGIAELFLLVGKFLPYLMVSAVFTFLYMFMPNTHVKFKSALVGGLAGGIMWATMGIIFTTFVLSSVRTLAVYATFAIGIVSLIWLYLNWLILLIGAQLAFYHQNPVFLRIGRQEPRLSNSMRERLALNIMMLVGRSFREPGKGYAVVDLSSRLNIPAIALAPIVERLEQAGLLLTTESETLVPGQELSRLRLNDILNVVRAEGETGSYRDPTWSPNVDTLGRELDRAVSGVVGDRTLAQLLDELEKNQPPGKSAKK
ncbi:MAG TPA: YihY/virulence factor BrkB family protein [Woeseiaceae bacterium]|nr:YihY/virulence factor BrkB family protein [Woeseiaceae bacterium]